MSCNETQELFIKCVSLPGLKS